MDLTDIIWPFVLIIIAIVAVAIIYFLVTAVKDRARAKREEKLAAEARARWQAPRRHGEGTAAGARYR